MIRLICPSCQVKLNAKEELAGQRRKCPKCGEPVEIPEAGTLPESASEEWDALDEVAPDQHVQLAVEEALPAFKSPERLVPLNRYLICDRTKLLAVWESSGQGWMLKTNVGLVSAKRNPEKLPSEGEFVLVELIMAMTDDGLRLRGVRSYELAKRWALTTLEQDQHRILGRVAGPGRLNRDQKATVQKFLRETLMREVWGDAREVLDYLSNFDYHSQGVG